MAHWEGEKKMTSAGFGKTEGEQEEGAPQPLTQQGLTLR